MCNVIFCVSKKLCALCKLRCVNCPCSLCNVHCSVQCVQCSVFSVHLCYLHPAAPHVRHSPVTPGAANDPAEAFAGEPRWPPHPRFVHFFNLCRPISGPAQICLKSNQNWFSAPWHGLTWPTWHMADDQTAPQHMATKSAQLCPGICFFCQCFAKFAPNQNLPWWCFFHIPTFDTGQWWWRERERRFCN